MKTLGLLFAIGFGLCVSALGLKAAAPTTFLDWTTVNFPSGVIESPSVTNKPFLPVWDGEQWTPNFQGIYLSNLPAANIVGTFSNISLSGIIYGNGSGMSNVMHGTGFSIPGNTATNSYLIVDRLGMLMAIPAGTNVSFSTNALNLGWNVVAPVPGLIQSGAFTNEYILFSWNGTDWLPGEDASNLTNLSSAALSGNISGLIITNCSITNAPFVQGSSADFTNMNVDTMNVDVLNATNLTYGGVAPFTGLITVYSDNEADDGPVTNTIAITNGLIMSWTQ